MYRTWEECEKDHVRMMTAMKQIERCLESVPLTEEVVADVPVVGVAAAAAAAPVEVVSST